MQRREAAPTQLMLHVINNKLYAWKRKPSEPSLHIWCSRMKRAGTTSHSFRTSPPLKRRIFATPRVVHFDDIVHFVVCKNVAFAAIFIYLTAATLWSLSIASLASLFARRASSKCPCVAGPFLKYILVCCKESSHKVLQRSIAVVIYILSNTKTVPCSYIPRQPCPFPHHSHRGKITIL